MGRYSHFFATLVALLCLGAMNAICTRIGIWSLPLHNMASYLPVLDPKHKILLLIDSISQCHLVFLIIFDAIDQKLR